ncbi:integrase domain-containing protein [Paraburkholderia sp.]
MCSGNRSGVPDAEGLCFIRQAVVATAHEESAMFHAASLALRTEAVLPCSILRTLGRTTHTSMQALNLIFGQKTVRRSVDQIGIKLASISRVSSACGVARSRPGRFAQRVEYGPVASGWRTVTHWKGSNPRTGGHHVRVRAYYGQQGSGWRNRARRISVRYGTSAHYR